MPTPRQTKRSAELEHGCDPQLLTPVTICTGENLFVRTDQAKRKLLHVYRADGSAMVAWQDMQKYWLHLALHPDNAICFGRFATAAEVKARKAADKAAFEKLALSWENN